MIVPYLLLAPPIIVWTGSQQFVQPKIIAIATIFSGLLVLKTRLRRTLFDLPVLAGLAVATAATWGSADFAVSLYGWPNDHAYGLAALLLYAVCYYAAAFSKDSLGLLEESALMAGKIVAGVALLQSLAFAYGYPTTIYDGRPVGTIGGPTYLGAYLAMVLPLAWGEPVALALIGAGVLVSESRAAWLAAAVSMSCLAWVKGWRPRLRLSWLLVPALVVAAVAGPSILLRPLGMSDAGRMEAWKAAAIKSRNAFWLGTGPSTYRALALTQGPGHVHQNAHNDLLQVRSTVGILGLAVYLLLWSTLVYIAWEAVAWLPSTATWAVGCLSLFVSMKFNPVAIEHLVILAVYAGTLERIYHESTET